MKRYIGFSTGAIGKGDIKKSLSILYNTSADAIELSALRYEELSSIVEALDANDLTQYKYVSVHAPSRFTVDNEPHIISVLRSLNLPIVVHPDTITSEDWNVLGSSLLIENMDTRKYTGKTVEELKPWFSKFPESKMCFDIGHAYQLGIGNVLDIIRTFKGKIQQVHLSLVDKDCAHHKIPTEQEMTRLLEYIKDVDAHIILETPCEDSEEVRSSISAVRSGLTQL